MAIQTNNKVDLFGDSVGNGPLKTDVDKRSDEQLALVGILLDDKTDYEGYTDNPVPDEPEESDDNDITHD